MRAAAGPACGSPGHPRAGSLAQREPRGNGPARRHVSRRTRQFALAIEALGAYFGYVRHPFAGESAVAVAERLAREAGIVTVPGPYFGTGQEPFLRLAFANADAATIALLGTRLP